MRVAALQLASSEDKQANYKIAEELLRAAAGDGAEAVVLPEMWTCFGSWEAMSAAAEELEGPTTAWATRLAKELQIDLIAGSFLQLIDGQRFNISLHIDKTGAIKAEYRKIHMFDVEVAGTHYRESEHESAGEEIVITELAGGVKAGLAICYDLRFPELFRIQAVEGALITLLPAAFTEPTTRDHWLPLLRARAIENQAFVVAANQCGETKLGRWGGRSAIIDPWGIVLAQAADRVGYIVAEIDLEHQRQIRNRVPSLANRRPETYRWPDR